MIVSGCRRLLTTLLTARQGRPHVTANILETSGTTAHGVALFSAKEHLRVVLGRDLPSGPIGQNSGKAEPNTSLNYSYFLSSLRGHTHSNLSKALILKVLSDISRSLSFLFHPFSPPLWKEPCHSTLAFLGCLPSADKDPAMQAGTGSLPEGTGSPQGPSEPLCESGSQCHTVCEMGRP